jgi:putative flippase GtrA
VAWLWSQVDLLLGRLRIARFGLIGVLSSLIYAAIVIIAVKGFGIEEVIASVIGYGMAIPVNFIGQKYYTFRSDRPARQELLQYVLVQAFNLAMAAAVTYAVDRAGMNVYLGIVAVVVVIPVMTYLLLKLAVFVPRV